MITDERPFSGTRPAIYSVNDKLPPGGQCVAVVTPYFQCRGFLDPGGDWRDSSDGSVIEDVQSWYLIDADEVKGQRSICIFGE
jgi:hypothetical protein